MAEGLDLSKQVGPMPLGAWIIVVAGGLGIAVYSRRNAGNTVVDDTSTPNGTADGSVGGWTDTLPSDTSLIGGSTTANAIVDNDSWAQAAIRYLIAQGYDANASYSAITRAMLGEQLSVSEYALWGAAIRGLGPPPSPVLVGPPSSVPGPVLGGTVQTRTPRPAATPAPTPAPTVANVLRGPFGTSLALPPPPVHAQAAPASYKYAFVTPAPLPGSSLKSLAQMFYGDSSKWHRIFNANERGQRRADGTPGLISDPDRLHVGWRLIIPT